MTLDATLGARDLAPKAAAYTASVVFTVDGTATDPGSVTYTVVNDAGTTVTSGTASGTGANARTIALTATHTSNVDILTITWVSATLGTLVTQVEIVGGFVFSSGQLDASLNRGGTASTYTTADKMAARVIATDAFEDACGVAFTTRYRKQKFDGNAGYDLLLPTPRLTTVRSVTLDGTAYTQAQLDDLEIYEIEGKIYNPWSWRYGRRNFQVIWEHGYKSPPADVSRAVSLIASSILRDGPFDDRGYAVTDDGGAVRLLTAGVAGAAFSIPEVESALARYRHMSLA